MDHFRPSLSSTICNIHDYLDDYLEVPIWGQIVHTNILSLLLVPLSMSHSVEEEVFPLGPAFVSNKAWGIVYIMVRCGTYLICYYLVFHCTYLYALPLLIWLLLTHASGWVIYIVCTCCTYGEQLGFAYFCIHSGLMRACLGFFLNITTWFMTSFFFWLVLTA